MSGHRWYSIFSLSLFAVLAGCQTDGSGKYAWNPFSRNAEKSDLAKEDSSFSLPKFASRKTEDAPEDAASTIAPMAAEQLERLLEQGQLALQENRLDDARKAYSEVLGSSPDNATAHHGMAMAADLSQQWGDAEYHYRQALRIRPRDANLLCDIGYSYLLQSRYSEASRYLNHAVEINPQHESAQMNLALLDLRQGNRPAAEQRINERFGSNLKSSQLLAQLETQAGKAGKSTDTQGAERNLIPANTTLEQVQEIAARERLDAERRRRMQGIPPEPAIVTASSTQQSEISRPHSSPQQAWYQGGFDPRTGMPLTHQPGVNPQGQSTSMPQQGIAQQGMPQQGSVIVANYGDSQPAFAPASNIPQNPPQWASAPAGIPQQGTQNLNSAVNPEGSNGTQPVAYGTNGLGVNSTATGSVAAAGMASSNTGLMNTGGPQTTSALSAASNAPGLGRVIPIHSSGTFPATPTSGVSYGQPAGFGSVAGQIPVNSANVNHHLAMSPNGIAGTMSASNSAFAAGANPQYSSETNGAQQLYLEGLNAGPGALFPIGQPASNQAVPAAHLQHSNAGSAADAGGSLRMGNISSPGTNSMINGAMYGQPQNTLPAQEWANQQSQQRPQNSIVQQSGTAGQPPIPGAWPAARPPQSNPLDVYDRQLQQLDNDYNNTLQQMDRQNPANRLLQ